MIFFTADLHFCHTKIIKLSERPFKSVEEMNEIIIKNWNECVQKDDLVYIIGDLSWASKGRTLPLVTRLKGKKILIKGNHDNLTKTAYREMGFLAVFNNCSYNMVISPTVNGEEVNLSHYPYYPSFINRVYVGIKEEIKELCGIRLAHAQKKTLKKRLKDDGRWLIHGHIHNKWKVKKKMINVGVDVWDFKPVSLETIKEILRGDKIDEAS